MAEVSMPRLSDTMQEGTIASWLKQPGEQINKGDVIAQIETDKATMDLTAFEAGTLEEILAPEGTTVAIGQPVARIGNGQARSTASSPPAAASAAAKPAAQGSPASEAAPAATAEDSVAATDGGATPATGAGTTAAAGQGATRREGGTATAAGADTAATGERAAAAARSGAETATGDGDTGATNGSSDTTTNGSGDTTTSGSVDAATGTRGGDTTTGRNGDTTTGGGGDTTASRGGDAALRGSGGVATDGSGDAATSGGGEAATGGSGDAGTGGSGDAGTGDGSAAAESGTPMAATDVPAATAAPTPANGDATDASNGKVRASPMARRLASERGLDLSKLSGSGPGGRVIRVDVEAALSSGQAASGADQPASSRAQTAAAAAQPATATPAAGADTAAPPTATEATNAPAAQPVGSPPPAADDERVPLSQMRRTIARRMAESTSTVPHFFLTTTVDVTDLVTLRKQILDQAADAGIKVSFNDLVVKGAALALRSVPEVNVSFDADSLIRHKHVHIGIAVATDRGLIVPVLRDADQKSLGEINRQTVDLAERARQGKLQPPDYSGGTFTISNLGMFGVEQFNAVINTPEAAILAVGAIAREPAEQDGQIVLRERMKLTLSVDHRALDGATGARYLQALKQLLEKPMLLLV
jgi:pyruvate dehydrogenase E2 component (dihydrolipoyllysine-residue acetyltransferase)